MRIVIAIAVSVFVHLILAAGLCWYFTVASASVVLAQLDVSSVELSLAEEDVETAVARSEMSPPDAERTPRPREDVKMEKPPVAELPDPTLPALDEPKPPEPSAPELPPMPSEAPKQARVDAPPKSKTAIRPEYPRGARLRKGEGDVLLEIHVTAAGDVGDVRIVGSSGFAELDEAAVRAAKAARFVPAKSGRDDVASVARLKLSFKLK